MSFDKIADALNAEQSITDMETGEIAEKIDSTIEVAKKTKKQWADEDFEFSRKSLRDAITSCVSMLPGLVSLAKVAESHQLYASASGMFKVLGDMNNSLVDNAIKVSRLTPSESRELAPAEDSRKPGNVENNTNVIVFDGDTTDFLSKLITEKKKAVIDV